MIERIWVSSEEPGNSNNNLNVLTMMLWQLQTEAAELFASRLVRNVRECCTHPRAVTCRTHCGKGLFGNIEWITPPSACLTCAGWAHRFLPIRGPPSSHPWGARPHGMAWGPLPYMYGRHAAATDNLTHTATLHGCAYQGPSR